MTKTSSARQRFVPGTSRGTRKAVTLLAQMADLKRGERVKELRLGRHMTQPAVAELTGVTLRAYQKWEEGGGIQWENVKRLAGVMDVPPEYIMRGDGDGQTPGPFPSPREDIKSQLDRIEQKVDALSDQSGTLTELERELLQRFEEYIQRIGRDIGKGSPRVRGAKPYRAAEPPLAG